jgi:hypothetical protein
MMVDLNVVHETNPDLFQEAQEAAQLEYAAKSYQEQRSLDDDWHSGFMEGYIYHAQKNLIAI